MPKHHAYHRSETPSELPGGEVDLVDTDGAGVEGLDKPEEDQQEDCVARLGAVHVTQADQEGHRNDVTCRAEHLFFLKGGGGWGNARFGSNQSNDV